MEDSPRIAVRLLDPRLTGWGFPRWGSPQAAGLDLHACLDAPLSLPPQGPPALVPAGIVLRIGDPGWCGFILPRSGLGHRAGLVLGNGTGVIDADYEGPLMISAWNRNPAGSPAIVVAPGDRIAQIVFVRVTRPRLEIDAGGTSEAGSAAGAAEGIRPEGAARGTGGFGSSGR